MSDMDHQAEIRAAIIENYNAYAEGLDSKNWPMVRECFADQVCLDYGGLSDATGSADVPRPSDDWIPALQSVINGFDITRHTITNHRFELTGDSVTCRAYLTAEHVIFPDPQITVAGEQDVVTVVGEYTNTYERGESGWKICRSKLVMNYTRGNLALLEEAVTRAVAQDQG